MNVPEIPFNKPVAIFRNTKFQRLGVNPETGRLGLMLLDYDDVPEVSDCPHEWRNGRLFVYVEPQQVTVAYQDSLRFTWKGGGFEAFEVQSGRIRGLYVGQDATWAQHQRLDGSHYDGFTGTFSLDEVDDLHIERTDLITKTTTRIEL